MQPIDHQSDPTLDAVIEAYAQWRASGHSKRCTPEHLQQQTVALLAHYPKSVLCKSLKISYSALKQWSSRVHNNGPNAQHDSTLATSSDDQSAFVQVPAIPLDSTLSGSSHDDQGAVAPLRIILPNGTALSTTIPLHSLLLLINQPVTVRSAHAGHCT